MRHGVRFGDTGEAFDGRAIETDALLESALQLSGRNGDALEVAEHIGEPQPDETDIAFFQRAQHEFLLTIHGESMPQVSSARL
ncbi:Uncharacterised protein [Mycobacteroides abscessus subsp. abscessus]|nr:Uncharacterised protein [Mycobacteroides abscessus subsp. abscessus]